jgi:hypothetical protein
MMNLVLEARLARTARRTSTPRCWMSWYTTRSLSSGQAHHKSSGLALEHAARNDMNLVLENKRSTRCTWTSTPMCRVSRHNDRSLSSGRGHRKSSDSALERATMFGTAVSGWRFVRTTQDCGSHSRVMTLSLHASGPFSASTSAHRILLVEQEVDAYYCLPPQ